MADNENPVMDMPETDSDSGASGASVTKLALPPINRGFNPDKAIQFLQQNPYYFVKPTTKDAANALFKLASDAITKRESLTKLNNAIQLQQTKTFLQTDTQKKAAEILAMDTNALPAGVLNKFYPDANGQPQTFNGDDVLAVNDAYKRIVVPTKSKSYDQIPDQKLAAWHAQLHSDPNADPTAIALADAEVARRTGTADGAAKMTQARIQNLSTKLDTAKSQLAGLATDQSSAGIAKYQAKQAEVTEMSDQIDALNGHPSVRVLGTKVDLTPQPAPTPSQSDVDYLKANPNVAPLFEKRFGAGTSKSILNPAPAPDSDLSTQ